MLFFNANFICYYFYPTNFREEPKISINSSSISIHGSRKRRFRILKKNLLKK